MLARYAGRTAEYNAALRLPNANPVGADVLIDNALAEGLSPWVDILVAGSQKSFPEEAPATAEPEVHAGAFTGVVFETPEFTLRPDIPEIRDEMQAAATIGRGMHLLARHIVRQVSLVPACVVDMERDRAGDNEIIAQPFETR